MPRNRWITPDATGGGNIARCLSVPPSLQPAVNGALQELLNEYNWEQVGNMTPAECVEAMTNVLSTYYESECDVPQTFPEFQHWLWTSGQLITGSSPTNEILSAQILNYSSFQGPPEVNDRIRFYAFLRSGTYTLKQIGRTDTASGIQHWIIDGVEQGETVDKYAAVAANNAMSAINVYLLTDGFHELDCKMATKNASSTGYRNRVTFFDLRRTGALP